MAWPDWLDRAEELATRTDTCLEHMTPYDRCKRGHLIRAALRDLWRAFRGEVNVVSPRARPSDGAPLR